jgi:hypothetical protein
VTPSFTRSWTDAFGSAYVALEGGTGSRVILVTAQLEAARDALATLGTLPAFKGRIVLCALTAMHAAPLLAALQQVEPSAVIALEAIDGIADRGAAVTLESGEFVTSTGLEYVESGECAAWQSTVTVPDALETPSLASSLAAIQGIPALACSVAQLRTALEIVRSSRRV